MKINSKFRSFILVLLSVIFLAVFFGVAQFVMVQERNKNDVYIPENSSFAIQIHGKEIFKKSVHDLLLEHPDAEIFTLLRNLSKKETGNQKVQESGINVLADLLIFNYPNAEGEFYGFIFQLNNAASFQKNILDEVAKNTGGVCNAKTGIVLLFRPHDKNKVLSKELIEKQAFEILNNPRREGYFTGKISKDDSFLSFEKTTAKDPSANFGKGNAFFQIKDSTLAITGKFASNTSTSHSNWNLKPNGFHLSSSMLTNEMKDSIQNQLKKQGFTLPKPARIAINYSGVQMGNGGIIPKMELLIEFDSVIHKETFVAPQSWRKLGFTISRSSDEIYQLTNGSSKFILQFLDAKTVFIGPNLDHLSKEKSNRTFYVTGDARYLTKIDGGGLVTMGLNLYPPFRTGKDFLETLKTTDIEIYEKEGNTFIQGEITFREGKSVTVEFMRLLLKINEF